MRYSAIQYRAAFFCLLAIHAVVSDSNAGEVQDQIEVLNDRAANTLKHEKEILDWREKRLESVKGPKSYLSLVGLFELTDGTHTFGFAPDDDFRLTDAAPRDEGTLGTFHRDGGQVEFIVAPGVTVNANKRIAKSVVMENDTAETPTVIEYASLEWFVIDRSGRLFVRVRDRRAPALDAFAGFEYFPVDPDLWLDAIYETFEKPSSFFVKTILGDDEKMYSTGKLRITLHGNEYVLQAQDEGDKLFVIFGDTTNGEETYGSGRFVYVDKPAPGEKTVLDFNKAYNPPCAYNDYTTCPLPPKSNIFPFPIRAGELAYEGER